MRCRNRGMCDRGITGSIGRTRRRLRICKGIASGRDDLRTLRGCGCGEGGRGSCRTRASSSV